MFIELQVMGKLNDIYPESKKYGDLELSLIFPGIQ